MKLRARKIIRTRNETFRASYECRRTRDEGRNLLLYTLHVITVCVVYNTIGESDKENGPGVAFEFYGAESAASRLERKVTFHWSMWRVCAHTHTRSATRTTLVWLRRFRFCVSSTQSPSSRCRNIRTYFYSSALRHFPSVLLHNVRSFFYFRYPSFVYSYFVFVHTVNVHLYRQLFPISTVTGKQFLYALASFCTLNVNLKQKLF